MQLARVGANDVIVTGIYEMVMLLLKMRASWLSSTTWFSIGTTTSAPGPDYKPSTLNLMLLLGVRRLLIVPRTTMLFSLQPIIKLVRKTGVFLVLFGPRGLIPLFDPGIESRLYCHPLLIVFRTG